MSTAAVFAKFLLAEDLKDIQHKEIQHDVGHLSIKDVACSHKQPQTQSVGGRQSGPLMRNFCDFTLSTH